MLWLIRDDNKKAPVFTVTFSALRSTNGYICLFSLQQQEAQPDLGSRTDAHSLKLNFLETTASAKTTFSLGRQQNVREGQDEWQTNPRNPTFFTQKEAKVSVLFPWFPFCIVLGRRQDTNLTFSSHPGTPHTETETLPFTASKRRRLLTGSPTQHVRPFWEIRNVFSNPSNLSKNKYLFSDGHST